MQTNDIAKNVLAIENATCPRMHAQQISLERWIASFETTNPKLHCAPEILNFDLPTLFI